MQQCPEMDAASGGANPDNSNLACLLCQPRDKATLRRQFQYLEHSRAISLRMTAVCDFAPKSDLDSGIHKQNNWSTPSLQKVPAAAGKQLLRRSDGSVSRGHQFHQGQTVVRSRAQALTHLVGALPRSSFRGVGAVMGLREFRAEGFQEFSALFFPH